MSTKISQSSKSHKLNSMAKDQLAAFSYVLYLYREELRKPRQSWMNKARSKFLLTHELVNKTSRNMHACSHEDLLALAREKEFKNQLYRQITRPRQQHNMRAMQNGKQQNANFQQMVKVTPQQQKLLQYQQQQQFRQQQQYLPQQQYLQQQQYRPQQKYQHQQQFQSQQQFQQQPQFQQHQQQFQQQHYQQQQFQQQPYYHQQAKRPCFNDYRTSSSSWKYS